MKKRSKSSSKTNFIVSAIFHTTLIGTIGWFAAKEGILGKKMQLLAVTMVKEKKIEPVKEKLPEPKSVIVKPVETLKQDVPQIKTEIVNTPSVAPPQSANPLMAPAPVDVPSFEFNDGAKAVNTISDPVLIYKSLIEHTILSRWNRPDGISDENYVAEVELVIDIKGKVESYKWLSVSGDKVWDASVKSVMDTVKIINRSPPKDFPHKFTVRFDVQSQMEIKL